MDITEKEALSQALHKAHSLKALLGQEFDALKKQDLSDFESLQNQKLETLNFLANEDLLTRVKEHSEDSQTAANNLALWDEVMGIIAECKELHQRNEVLISRKLESIRGALQTIQTPDPLSSVEVYDRLGKIRSNRGRQTMGDA